MGGSYCDNPENPSGQESTQMVGQQSDDRATITGMQDHPSSDSPRVSNPHGEEKPIPGYCIIVMGVSGSGKSGVGSRVAEALGARFIDGDDLHPESNIAKMAHGIPLQDEDRLPWLDRIREAARTVVDSGQNIVIACSALKRAYRERLRLNECRVSFLFLDGDYELVSNRMKQRTGHFMKEAMLKSQFQTLERPVNEPDVLEVDIRLSMDKVAGLAVELLRPRLSGY
jgi:gluconokinase